MIKILSCVINVGKNCTLQKLIPKNPVLVLKLSSIYSVSLVFWFPKISVIQGLPIIEIIVLSSFVNFGFIKNFLPNYYFISQIHHAKSFKIRPFTSLYFNLSVLFQCYYPILIATYSCFENIWPWKNQVQTMGLQKAGCKKLGLCYQKREETRLLLLFLNNTDPGFLHPAFCNPYFGPFLKWLATVVF